MAMTVDISIPAADTVGGMRSGFAALHLAAAVSVAAVRVVRHAVILAASQPGILTVGVSAVGICGVRCRACFLRQRQCRCQRLAPRLIPFLILKRHQASGRYAA